jgi:hypothetical protein
VWLQAHSVRRRSQLCAKGAPAGKQAAGALGKKARVRFPLVPAAHQRTAGIEEMLPSANATAETSSVVTTLLPAVAAAWVAHTRDTWEGRQEGCAGSREERSAVAACS